MANRSGAREEFVQLVKANNPIFEVMSELAVINSQDVRYGEYRGPCFHGHETTSGTCMLVRNGIYHCFSCGNTGDVLDVVQVVKQGGKRPGSFSAALRWLSERANLQPPESYSWKKVESDDIQNWRAHDVLAAAKTFYVSCLDSENRSFLAEKYALTFATTVKFSIGLARGQGLLDELTSKGFTEAECLSSGLFVRAGGKTLEFFNRRIVFPYMTQKRVTYFIGRKTAETPDVAYEQAKYKKLLTQSEKHSYVAPGVRNDTIFNQDVAYAAQEVIITEGITDCIALDQAGLASISPVTVKFKKSDQDHLLRILRKDQKIFICNDNEWNKTGESGALDTAIMLSNNGLNVRIINLPLLEKHRDARAKLEAIC